MSVPQHRIKISNINKHYHSRSPVKGKFLTALYDIIHTPTLELKANLAEKTVKDQFI